MRHNKGRFHLVDIHMVYKDNHHKSSQPFCRSLPFASCAPRSSDTARHLLLGLSATPRIHLILICIHSITYEMSSSDKVHLFTLLAQSFISVEPCSSSNSFLLDFPKAESLIYHGDASLIQMDPRDTVSSLSSDVYDQKVWSAFISLLRKLGLWNYAHTRTPTPLKASDIRYGELKCSCCAGNPIWLNITAVSLSHGSVWGQPVWTR